MGALSPGSGPQPAPEKLDVPGPLADVGGQEELARKEAQAFAGEQNLEELAKASAHKRRETFLQHFHWAVIILIWVIFLALLSAGVTWLFHLLTPVRFHYLDAVTLDKIQATFFTGIISAALTSWISRKYIQ